MTEELKYDPEKEILESLQRRPTELGKEKYLKIKKMAETKKFPEDWNYIDYNISNHTENNFDYNDWSIQFYLRKYYIENIGFMIITNNLLKLLSNYIGNKKCLEIMCGKGVLTYGLRQKGIDIIATDNLSWQIAKSRVWLDDIENIDAINAIEKYGKDIDFIICSWPPMGNNNTMYKVLLKMREINPNCKLIYIGEDCGGCCADDEFFDIVNYLEDKDFESITNYIYQWDGIHDILMLMN